MTFSLIGIPAGFVCAVMLFTRASTAPTTLGSEHPRAQEQDMQKMMEAAKRYTQPGPMHEHLERYLGTWKTETRIFMGATPTPAEAGTAEFEWLMDGRWVKGSASGNMMGMPMQSFMLVGYDNFKMSFVTTMVSSMDTAMLRSEGDLTQDGKTLLTYGTLDEYLTGEHDKMVKYVWRFVGPDEFVLEVHDLPIGEANTKVVEVRYRRS